MQLRLEPQKIRFCGWSVAVLAATALLLLVSLYVRPINHDEGQYVAAVALMRGRLPFRDFAYLQMPLQPLVLAPLALLNAGWLLVACRLANVVFAWSTIALLVFGLRGRVPTWASLVAVAALTCADVFLFAGSVARNDALPMALLAGAVAVFLRAEPLDRRSCLGAGLLLGLATSAKISFAFPAAGAGLFLLCSARRIGFGPFIMCAAGGLAGLLPSLVLAVWAPEQFYFDVFTYSLQAPQQWWASIGRADLLTPTSKLLGLAKFASLGAILLALLAAALDRARTPIRTLLDCMIVGGLIAAYLPDPTFRQYLAPLLPPLFARLALALSGMHGLRRYGSLALVAAFSVVGLDPTAAAVAKTIRHGSDLRRTFDRGEVVAALARGGLVVTLAPEQVAGANVALDRRFVTGPFLFRTHGSLARQALRLGYSPNWQDVAALDRQAPAAILVGTEVRPRSLLQARRLDDYLVRWARIHGYHERKLDGGATLYLRDPR